MGEGAFRHSVPPSARPTGVRDQSCPDHPGPAPGPLHPLLLGWVEPHLPLLLQVPASSPALEAALRVLIRPPQAVVAIHMGTAGTREQAGNTAMAVGRAAVVAGIAAE